MVDASLAKKFVQSIATLRATYGPQGWWPRVRKTKKGFCVVHRIGLHRGLSRPSVFEVSLGAILTQNASWMNVEKAIACLAEKKMITPKRIVSCPIGRLESCVTSSGYFHQKAKKLKILSQFFLSHQNMDRASLLALWGIGPETADTILLYGSEKKIFVVDAYTRRLLVFLSGDKRWLTRPYDEVRLFCESAFSGSVRDWQEAHALIVRWGKDRSVLRKPSAAGRIRTETPPTPA